MDEKEILRKLIEKIDEALESDGAEGSLKKDTYAKSGDFNEEWTMRTYNFMKKYGHIS